MQLFNLVTQVFRDYSKKSSARYPVGLGVLATAALGLGACVSGGDIANSRQTAEGNTSDTVNLITYDSYAISEETVAEFERESGLQVNVIKYGNGVELANKLILTKDAPVADAVFGLDNNVGADVLEADLIAPFTGDTVPDAILDTRDLAPLVAVDYGEVCLNYDIGFFAEKQLSPPSSYAELTDSRYRDMLVVLDPRTSTPGLAFLLGTIQFQGKESWQEYWHKLRDNGVKVSPSWSDAFAGDFTAGSNESGSAKYPLMVSYASSPAWAVSEDLSASTIGNVPGTCYLQVEFAGVLKKARNPQGAQALVQFLTEATAQKDLAENNYMYPILSSVELPAALAKFGAPSGKLQSIASQEVTQNRETWVRQWAEVMK